MPKVAWLLVPMLLIGCAKSEVETPVSKSESPPSTFEVAKDPTRYWNEAIESAETDAVMAGATLAAAANQFSRDARQKQGDERHQALVANINRMEEGIARLEKSEVSAANASIVQLRMQLAWDQLAAGQLREAEETADSVLAGNTDPQDWNYGNAIHEMHMIKAEVALERGIPAEARRQILLAAETPGSPQLDSFGPKFGTVYKLYKAGDREIMVEYLTAASKFWKSDQVEDWIKEVKAGKEPKSELWKAATRPN